MTKFNCKHFGQSLEIDDSYLGDKVICPTCNQETLVLICTQPYVPRKRNGSVTTKIIGCIAILAFTIIIVMGIVTKDKPQQSLSYENVAPVHTLFTDGNNRYNPYYKILDVNKEGARIAEVVRRTVGGRQLDDDIRYENDIFVYGLHGYSDRIYKSQLDVQDMPAFTYPTTTGGHRTIPAYRLVSR